MALFEHDGLVHYFRLEGGDRRPTLLLIHAIGSDHSLWDKVVPMLTPVVRVLRHDLRGHGGSGTPRHPCTVEQLAGDVLALTRALNIERFAVAGVSLGAMVAMKLAALAADRVRALAVTSCSPRMPTPPGGGWDARIRATLEQGMAVAATGTMSRMFSPGYLEQADPHVETLRNAFTLMDPKGYASCAAVLRDADLWPVLPTIQAPTLAIGNRGDLLIPLDTAAAIASAVPDGRTLTLDCGHFPPVEAPEPFARTLLGFLGQVGFAR